MVVVLLLAEMTHDQEVLGSSPANSKLFFQQFKNLLAVSAPRTRMEQKITA